ncbi:ISL3 family transposase [Deinococcus cavernae]|uniref:ISL3 family transposase n=1 Tax=Deinococcus cavernae TaxID=2320857 RepID=A0A418VJ54_9DEIO|nr:ISL3 family transposase [Deinococcus cavernae]RJF75940.1 ISL3 family transposase [Deinococcus cavernae]RJF76164.1 ISL3 family transposase [Deinococcus cavernae]
MSALTDAYCLPEIQFGTLHMSPERLEITAETMEHSAVCPHCGQLSQRVHGYYWRHPKDLPCGAKAVQLSLRVRRFLCLNPACSMHTFSSVSKALPAFSRRTARLQTVLARLGFGMGAERAATTSHDFHISASPDAILRIMKTQPLPDTWTPRVLGVDDWAIRKGQTYGTILIDLERHQVIDVLKDRSTAVLRDWLKAHPGIEIITRDRASDYSRAVTEAAPKALQIADRWHLLCNLSGLVREWILRERSKWKEVISTVKTKLAEPESVTKTGRKTGEGRRQQYQEVILLGKSGGTYKEIAAQTGVPYATVRWWLRGDGSPDDRSPLTEAHRDKIKACWTAGIDSSLEILRQLKEMGYTGSVDPVRRLLYHLDLEQGLQGRSVPARPRAHRRDFNTTALTRLLTMPRSFLADKDQRFVDLVCDGNREIAAGYALVQRFRNMFLNLTGDNKVNLQSWLSEAARSTVVELRQFAASVERDFGAVSAALTMHWSNAQTEGQVNKLKLTKRRHFGRASFELLRRCVLLA